MILHQRFAIAAPMPSLFNPTHYAARKRAEARFSLYGKLALGFSVLMLALLLGNVVLRGTSGFQTTTITLPIVFSDARLNTAHYADVKDIPTGTYLLLMKDALSTLFPGTHEKAEVRELMEMVSTGASSKLRQYLIRHPKALGSHVDMVLPASSNVDQFLKHGDTGKLSVFQHNILRTLQESGRMGSHFNVGFITHADSRLPEQAGFLGAMAGSLLTMVVCFLIAFPMGVASAVYLQEFAPQNCFTDVIEVNISNLAAVPSIVFGLLGLSVYINMAHLPRSAPVVGGLTLALMILPVIIIATRTALGAVPPSIRQAALALGATPLQVVWHHTLPLATPGIMTGTILGLSRALGETAPLLMIGMVAFVADVPTGFADPATVMPVQIYLWATSPESGFVEKTASGIMVLIVLLLAMNAAAIYIRRKFEVRW